VVPLLLLAALAAVLRLLGSKGKGPGTSWRIAFLYALSATSVITGAAVFTRARQDMARMVPASVPHPEAWVTAVGVTQIVAGAGLAVPATRPVAVAALAAVVCIKLPANWKAAREGLTIRGRLPTPPWMRIPNSILWLGLILWVAGARTPRPV